MFSHQNKGMNTLVRASSNLRETMFLRLSLKFLCGGLRPLAEALCIKRAFYAVLGNFWCSVVPSVNFSSNLSNYDKIPPKKIMKI